MNDTTRDELIEQVAELADQFACGAAGEPVVYALHGPTDFAEEVIALVQAAAGDDLDADMTLAYIKGWQDGQDAMRKSVDAATLTSALAALGPGTSVTYIGQEGPLWWVELRLPESRYLATLVTDSGSTLDEAFVATVQRALTFAKEQGVTA